VTARPTPAAVLEAAQSEAQKVELSVKGWVPNACLGLNGRRRTHWATQRKAMQDCKTVFWLMVAAWKHKTGMRSLPSWEKARVEIEFTYPTNRRRDRDNETAKAKGLIDGLVESGLLKDDDAEHLVALVVTPRYVRGGTGTVITVERWEDGA